MGYVQEDYLNMKTPLSYQLSEYDCGTTTLLNSLRYLFKRGEIPPFLIKGMENYSLDTYNSKGELGKNGTSAFAIEFISN